jgi:iron complex transport system ATP-binding protein
MEARAGAAADADAAILRLSRGCVHIQGATLLQEIDFALVPRTVTGLIGPNGAGKSTLLRVLARQQPPSSGEIRLDGRPYASFRAREFARRVAYLPQSIPAAPGLTVAELVRLGRFPWHGPLGRFAMRDRAAVERALAATGMDAHAPRYADTLSGGERQRCWIAMLLAQEAEILLMDEPVAALDVRHQIETMELVRRIARERDVSILVVLHDVNLAARYCDQVTALKSGRTAWSGTARALMDPGVLTDIYGTPIAILPSPDAGIPFAVAMPAS